jgi:hypothetical protein
LISISTAFHPSTLQLAANPYFHPFCIWRHSVDVLHVVAQVVPTEFRLQFEDRPGGDIVYALSGMGKVSDLKSKSFVLKEGCSYRLQVTFKTQHEIVTGLKFVNTVTRRTSIQ